MVLDPSYFHPFYLRYPHQPWLMSLPLSLDHRNIKIKITDNRHFTLVNLLGITRPPFTWSTAQEPSIYLYSSCLVLFFIIMSNYLLRGIIIIKSCRINNSWSIKLSPLVLRLSVFHNDALFNYKYAIVPWLVNNK